jgi:LPS O-antigen subunit length determinant protein (WzzB/FepE family)
MCSPGVIARLGLGSAILLCAVNVTLLANAAWEARLIVRKPTVPALAAENTSAASNSRPSDPPHVVGVAEQSGALASRR